METNGHFVALSIPGQLLVHLHMSAMMLLITPGKPVSHPILAFPSAFSFFGTSYTRDLIYHTTGLAHRSHDQPSGSLLLFCLVFSRHTSTTLRAEILVLNTRPPARTIGIRTQYGVLLRTMYVHTAALQGTPCPQEQKHHVPGGTYHDDPPSLSACNCLSRPEKTPTIPRLISSHRPTNGHRGLLASLKCLQNRVRETLIRCGT